MNQSNFAFSLQNQFIIFHPFIKNENIQTFFSEANILSEIDEMISTGSCLEKRFY
jgi:hypothetical protein